MSTKQIVVAIVVAVVAQVVATYIIQKTLNSTQA